jgi:CBS domain containing-hemolysin-like protein
LVAVDRSMVERLAEEGNRGAISTLKALKSLSFQLSGAQLGITMTSLIVGFIARPTIGDLIEPLFHDLGLPSGAAEGAAIIVALGLATATEMVVGELVPQNLAIARPAPTAFRVATPLRLYNSFFRPLIVFLNGAANLTVRLLGIEPKEELRSLRSLEDLDLLIRASRAEGSLEESEGWLLGRVISFESKVAADALTPRTSVVWLPQDARITDLAETALESGHSRFPIVADDLDNIIGTVLVKDVYRFEPEARPSTPVTEIMDEPLVVPESRDLGSLLTDMRSSRRHLAIVIDEHGGTAGIITLEDLLEEIVGEIEDEYDPSVPDEVDTTPEGIHVVSAMLRPDEVLEAAGFDMPEGDFETLGGFLLSLFGEIPEIGDHASYEGWELKVVGMDDKRIDRVLVVAPPPGPEEADE